jgi:predicted amidohydrolase YtcJ
MEIELEGVVRILAENRWPWRLHATYDETISRSLDVFERVNRDLPLAGLNWFFDHAETISERSMDRIAALGGGIAIQHRMAYQGEYFLERYGAAAASATPPVTQMIEKGLRISAGTDATRVASYNPWVCLAWLITGRTVGGMRLYAPGNCLDRETALRLWTQHATWFSGEEGRKGQIKAGQLADLIVPSRDYFGCAGDEIAALTSDLTLVGGKVVYAAGAFAAFDQNPPPPAMPDWSPVRNFGGYGAWGAQNSRGSVAAQGGGHDASRLSSCAVHGHQHAARKSANLPIEDLHSFWGALGCACWAI